MGFNSDKSQVLKDLEDLNYDHQGRAGKNEDENLLAAGLLSTEDAIGIVKCTRGNQHENRQHHQVGFPKVWIMKPSYQGVDWYIKGYFLGDQTWFISFHPSKS